MSATAHGLHLDAHASGFWRIADPQGVREVLGRPGDFAPTNALTAVVPLTRATLRTLARAGFALPAVLASATGAEHRLVRAVTARFFAPRRVAATRTRIADLTRHRAEAVGLELDQGPVDLAERITAEVPPVILGELIGVKLPDTARLRRWSRHSLELFWGCPDADRQSVLVASAVEFFSWLRDHLTGIETGLFGDLRQAGVGVPQRLSLAYFLLIAGQHTTAMLTDIALHRALRTRGAWPRLATGAAAAALVRQVLATESSVPTWRRIATRDTVVAGQPIPRGTEILLELTGSAPAAPALAFGHGVHRCLGARLAELEASVILTETAAALPDLAPAGAEPAWLRLLSFQAPRTVWAQRAGLAEQSPGTAVQY